MNRKEREKKIKFRDTDYTENELFESEEVRQRVYALNELERETEILERITRLNQKKSRELLVKQNTESNNNIRKKDAALLDIKKKRSQKLDKNYAAENDNLSSFSSESESGQINNENDSKSDSSDSSDSSDDNYSYDSNSKKQSNKKKERKLKDKRSRLSFSSSSVVSNLSDISDISDDKSKIKDAFTLSINDIERARLTRDQIDKYWELPIFDENAKGCFVKINVTAKSSSNSSGYMLCQIKDIKENKDKPYIFGNKQCSKYILVTHCLQEKEFILKIISNSPISDVEFRVWKDRMEKYKVELPTIEKIRISMENIEKIKNYTLTNAELKMIVEKKKDLKIKHLDKNMNITYELSLLTDEYNSAKQKYDEIGEKSYLSRMEVLRPKIENLRKMAQDRDKEEILRFEVDRISQINKKNYEMQKLNDIRNSMINRKKKRSDIVDPHKRRDCRPINLFNKRYTMDNEIKTDTLKVNEEIKEDDNVNFEFSAQKIFQNRKKKLVKVENYFRNLSDELVELKKFKEDNRKDNPENNFIFQILGISKPQLTDLVSIHNSKLEIENSKIITINDLEY